MELLPAPTTAQLRALREVFNWSPQQAANAFWLRGWQHWYALEAGERRMDRARWTLGVLARGAHPSMALVLREQAPPGGRGQGESA